MVDTLLLDKEMVYALMRDSNDRLLLGLKGSLNEYELDLFRARSVEAQHVKARRGELVVSAPVGFLKNGGPTARKDPDRRVQEAILLDLSQVLRAGLGEANLTVVFGRRAATSGPPADWRRSS